MPLTAIAPVSIILVSVSVVWIEWPLMVIVILSSAAKAPLKVTFPSVGFIATAPLSAVANVVAIVGTVPVPSIKETWIYLQQA